MKGSPFFPASRVSARFDSILQLCYFDDTYRFMIFLLFMGISDITRLFSIRNKFGKIERDTCVHVYTRLCRHITYTIPEDYMRHRLNSKGSQISATGICSNIFNMAHRDLDTKILLRFQFLEGEIFSWKYIFVRIYFSLYFM